MRKSLQRYKNVLDKHPFFFRVCLAVLITALQFLCIHLIVPVLLPNDDLLAETAISGSYSGSQVAVYPFLNMVLVKGLQALYRLLPAIPWYAVILEASLILSCFSIQFSILLVFRKKMLPLWLAEVIYFVFFFISILYVAIPISFTYVSCFCGAAAVSLLLSGAFSKEHMGLQFAGSVCFLWLAFLIRPEGGLIGMCFFLLCTVFSLLLQARGEQEKKNRRHFYTIATVFAVTAICGCGLLLTANNAMRDTPDGHRIEEWNTVRSNLLDYHKTSYSTDSEFYESIGWNEEFYELQNEWYLLDDQCDYAHYAAIDHYTVTEKAPQSVSHAALSAAKTVVSYVKSIYFAPLLISFAGLFALGVWLGIRKRRQGGLLYLAFIVCAMGGTLLMWLYLAYIGRLASHVFRICCIPAVICMLLSDVHLLSRTSSDKKGVSALFGWGIAGAFFLIQVLLLLFGTGGRQTLLRAFAAGSSILFAAAGVYACRKNGLLQKILIAVACLVLSVLSARSIMNFSTDCSVYLAQQEKYSEKLRYASAHPEEILISIRERSPVRLDYVYTYGRNATNLFYSVDFLLYSDAYENKLAMNGIESLTVDSYFTDNVYYIGDSENDETLELLLAYMRTQYGDSVTAEVHAELENGVSVYQFSR